MAKTRADRANETRTTYITDNDLKQNDSERVNVALEGIQEDVPYFKDDNLTANATFKSLGYTEEPTGLGQFDFVYPKYLDDNFLVNLGAGVFNKFALTTWTAESSANPDEEDGFYYAEFTHEYDSEDLIIQCTANIEGTLQFLSPDLISIIDADTVRVRQYGNSPVNALVIGKANLESIIGANIAALTDEFFADFSGDQKGYLYVDMDATDSTGIRNTRTPYPTLAAAKADYESGDIIAVEKLTTADNLISEGESIVYKPIDYRKTIALTSAQTAIANNSANTYLKVIDGKIFPQSNASAIINSVESTAGTNYTELDIEVDQVYGVFSLNSAIGRIKVKLIDGKAGFQDTVIQSFNRLNFGVPIDKQGYFQIELGDVFIGNDVNNYIFSQGLLIGSTNTGNNFHIKKTNYTRTFSGANRSMSSPITVYGNSRLENVTINDQKSTGSIIFDGGNDVDYEVIGVCSFNNSGTVFTGLTNSKFIGTGIVIHNGEIVYNGSNEDYYEEI